MADLTQLLDEQKRTTLALEGLSVTQSSQAEAQKEDTRTQEQIAADQKKMEKVREARANRESRLNIVGRVKAAADAIKNMEVQEGISKGIEKLSSGFNKVSDTFKSIKDKTVDAVKDIGTFGLLLFLPALMAFLNSPFYDKAKKYILENVLPALTRFYKDYLVPLGKKLDELGIGKGEIGLAAILLYITKKLFPIVKVLGGAFIDLGVGIVKFAGKITGVLIKYGLLGAKKLAGILKDAILALGTAITNMGKGVKKFATKIGLKSKIAAGLTSLSTTSTKVLAPAVASLKTALAAISTSLATVIAPGVAFLK